MGVADEATLWRECAVKVLLFLKYGDKRSKIEHEVQIMILQQIVVFLIVAAAVAYICRMLWGALFGKGGCHSCSSNCGSHGTKDPHKKVAMPQHLIQMQTEPIKRSDASSKTH